MMTLEIKTNVAQLEREFNTFARKELPYAVARGLTAMAKQAQAQVRAELPSHFTIRNNYVSRGIAVIPAKKTDWPHAQAIVLCKDAFMTDHEEGATRQAGSLGFVATPISPGQAGSVRPDQTQIIQPRLRAKKLLQLTKSKKNYHLVKLPRSGSLGIMYKPTSYVYRNSKKASHQQFQDQSKSMYVLPQEIKLKKRWDFVERAMSVSIAVFHQEMILILAKEGLK